MTGADDYYGEARRFSTAMRSEGFEENARALEDAIAAGFTSTEVLMALRWHLARFLTAKPGGPPGLQRRAKALHQRIDLALAQNG